MTEKRQSRPSSPRSPTVELARSLRNVQRALQRVVEEAGAELPADWSPEIPLTQTSRAGWNERAADLLGKARRGSQTSAPLPSLPEQRLWCSQCKSDACTHAPIPGTDHTFDGYAATGKPTWVPFVQLCLRTRPPEMDRLFEEPPGVVVMKFGWEELHENRLAAFETSTENWQVAGLVVAGLIPADLQLRSSAERIVITLLVLRTNVAGRRHLRLNLLGISQSRVDALAASGSQRSPAEQFRRTLKRARKSLDKLERMELSEPEMNARIDTLLSRLRGDLARVFSAQSNRTKHAQQRHQSAARPTSLAIADARGASMERILFDVPRDTFVVLGRKGRAHIFSRTARHVTSMRLEDGEVSRKKRRQRWREVTPNEYRTLRRHLDAHDENQRPVGEVN